MQAYKKKMAVEPSGIPLADVLRAANELVSAGLIKDYALGGALAAIYYTEPFTTYDADIIFVPSDKTLSAVAYVPGPPGAGPRPSYVRGGQSRHLCT